MEFTADPKVCFLCMARGLPLSENRFLESECPRCEALKVRFVPTQPGYYWMKLGDREPTVVYLDQDLLVWYSGNEEPSGLSWLSKDETILWGVVNKPDFKKVFPFDPQIFGTDPRQE